ncbi:MAG TPA: hypothetical protein VMJ94_04985 [Nitrososphaera sp.]|nr:hypothetical protein [Nitrososphaera sp.]
MRSPLLNDETLKRKVENLEQEKSQWKKYVSALGDRIEKLEKKGVL